MDGPALERRLAEFDALVAKAGLGMRRLDDGLAIRFAVRGGVQAELERWIAVEGECCPSMTWVLMREGGGDVLLTLSGSAEVRDYLLENVPSIGRLSRI